PMASHSKMPKLSMPTNGPTTSLKPLEQTTENQNCHPCATASPWLGVSVATSSKASPIRTLAAKPAPTRPAADAKLLPPWGAAAENKPPNAGTTQHTRTIKRQHENP